MDLLQPTLPWRHLEDCQLAPITALRSALGRQLDMACSAPSWSAYWKDKVRNLRECLQNVHSVHQIQMSNFSHLVDLYHESAIFGLVPVDLLTVLVPPYVLIKGNRLVLLLGPVKFHCFEL